MKKLLLATTLVLGMLGLAKADTTTSRFLLTKPDVGSTNWGPKINVNYDLIDLAAGIAIANTFTSSNTFNAAVAFGAQVLNSAGSAAAPSISFTGSPTTGFYLGASGVVEIGTVGSRAFEVGNSSVTSVYPIFAPLGSVSAPAYTFVGLGTSGFYADSSPAMYWTIGGSTIAYGVSTGFVSPSNKTLTASGPTALNGTITLAGAISQTGQLTLGNSILDRNLTAGTTWDVLRSSGSSQTPIWSHAGLILQSSAALVNAYAFATTNSAFQASGFKVTIAPKFASSKVRISWSGDIRTSSLAGDFPFVTVERNATNIAPGGGTNYFSGLSVGTLTGTLQIPASLVTYDSPATTSAVTYEMYLRTSAGGATATMCAGAACSLVVEEIGQ